MSIESRLSNIKSNLEAHKRSREECLYQAVANRLDKVLTFYEYELMESIKFVNQYEDITIYRKL